MRGPRTAMKSGPRLPQLEKALAQKRRPNTAINKYIKKKKKSESWLVWWREACQGRQVQWEERAW